MTTDPATPEGFDYDEWVNFDADLNSEESAPPNGKRSSLVESEAGPDVDVSELSLTNARTHAEPPPEVPTSHVSPGTSDQTKKVLAIDLLPVQDGSSIELEEWLHAFQAQSESGDSRLCVSMAGFKNAFSKEVKGDEIPFRKAGSLGRRTDAHAYIGYQTAPGNLDSVGMSVSVEARDIRNLDEHRVWTLWELRKPIDLSTKINFLHDMETRKPTIRMLAQSASAAPLRPRAKPRSTMYCVHHDTRHAGEFLYQLSFRIAGLLKNDDIPQPDRLFLIQGTAGNENCPPVWSGAFGLVGKEQTRKKRNSKLPAQANRADDPANPRNSGSGDAVSDPDSVHETLQLEGHPTTTVEEDDSGVSKRHRPTEDDTALLTRDVPSPILSLPGPLFLAVKAYSELYAPESHAGEVLGQEDQQECLRAIGLGALGRLDGWRVPASQHRWHASDEMDRLFEILVQRVNWHIVKLGETTSSTMFVPYIGDVHGGSITFEGEGEARKVKQLRPSVDRMDGEEKRDILHILARLAFVTHILTLANFSTNISERALPVHSKKRSWACGRAGGRVEAEILHVFFAERHNLSDRFARSPSQEERIRFWRFVDIEYCDYVAYFAELAHKAHRDGDFNKRSRLLDEACLRLFVLEGNEEWFDAELQQSLEPFTVSGYMNLNRTEEAWLADHGPSDGRT